MKEQKIGTMKFNSKGLRELADAIDKLFGKDAIITMPVWVGNDGLYMQLIEESGFIDLIK